MLAQWCSDSFCFTFPQGQLPLGGNQYRLTGRNTAWFMAFREAFKCTLALLQLMLFQSESYLQLVNNSQFWKRSPLTDKMQAKGISLNPWVRHSLLNVYRSGHVFRWTKAFEVHARISEASLFCLPVGMSQHGQQQYLKQSSEASCHSPLCSWGRRGLFT